MIQHSLEFFLFNFAVRIVSLLNHSHCQTYISYFTILTKIPNILNSINTFDTFLVSNTHEEVTLNPSKENKLWFLFSGCLYKDRRWIIKRFTIFNIVASTCNCTNLDKLFTKNQQHICLHNHHQRLFFYNYYHYYVYISNVLQIKTLEIIVCKMTLTKVY